MLHAPDRHAPAERPRDRPVPRFRVPPPRIPRITSTIQWNCELAKDERPTVVIGTTSLQYDHPLFDSSTVVTDGNDTKTIVSPYRTSHVYGTVDNVSLTNNIATNVLPNKRIRIDPQTAVTVVPGPSVGRNLLHDTSEYSFASSSLSSVETVLYTDIFGFVAANGYGPEMDPALGICKDVYYRDELAWSSVVNLPYGEQHKTHFLYSILTHNSPEVYRRLRYGAKINQRCGIYLSSTPFIISCLEGNPEIVQLLCEYGADITELPIQVIYRPEPPEGNGSTVRNTNIDDEGEENNLFPSSLRIRRYHITIPHVAVPSAVYKKDAPRLLPVSEIGLADHCLLHEEGDDTVDEYNQHVSSSFHLSPIIYGNDCLYWILYGYYYNNPIPPRVMPPLLGFYKDILEDFAYNYEYCTDYVRGKPPSTGRAEEEKGGTGTTLRSNDNRTK